MPSLSANPTKSKNNTSQHLWQTLGIGADIFTLNNKNYLCIVDYHSKFPIVKRAEDMSIKKLNNSYIFRIWIAKKVMSDAGGNFISDKFRQFYKCMNIEQNASLSYNH